MEGEIRATGGCLCGAVRYEVRGPLRPVVDCHCEQCRRTSGHFAAATAAWKRDLHVTGDESLRWYRSSEEARRGFCTVCGSSILWEPLREDWVSIMAGTLDAPTGLRTGASIFVSDAGDYYEVDRDIPGRDDGAHGLSPDD